MVSNETYVAATRFGLGIRPDEASRIAASPGEWLVQQIQSPMIKSNAFSSLPSSAQNAQRLLVYQQKHKNNTGDAKIEAQKEIQELYKSIDLAEASAKLEMAITTPTPLYERLVNFWSNHFAVSLKKGGIDRAIAFSYEREVIRPNVMGKFEDMLLDVVHHPAMLHYLDNAQSIGPDSKAGMRQEKGLNENLAREIMELHTLGVGSGYTQQDVTTFAKVITGWGIAGPNTNYPGIFEFNPRRHEPGTQRILGRNYADNGEGQGIAVLRDLAHNPKTAHHIATKLVRHFVADQPPEPIVKHIADVFMESKGYLPQVYDAIIRLPEAWDVQNNPKIKSSFDLIVSSMRATQRSDEDALKYALNAIKFLGNAPFTAESPAGFSDVAHDMIGPESMIQRVEWAQMAAHKLDPSQPAMELAELTIGPVMSGTTRSAIANANNRYDAVALLFGSPEFQKR